MFADIKSLPFHAGIYVRHFGFHRIISKLFLYAIYDVCDDDAVYGYAILDYRRSPERLSQSRANREGDLHDP